MLSAKIISFFEKRCISQKTLIDFKITEGVVWMPRSNKEVNTIQFHFFRNGELVNTHYRSKEKHYKLLNSELLFYNFAVISKSKDIYLVEGEIDCLSMYECGLNAISVPEGATLDLSYLDVDLFKGKNIYLAFDNDEQGRQLRNMVAQKFGVENCSHIEFEDCKDANEYLVKYGKERLLDICKKPIKFPPVDAFTQQMLSRLNNSN